MFVVVVAPTLNVTIYTSHYTCDGNYTLLPPGGRKNAGFFKTFNFKQSWPLTSLHLGKKLPVKTFTVKYMSCFSSPCLQKQLLQDDGQNALMKKVLDTYLLFFQINQSTATLRHVFASLRLFVQKVLYISIHMNTSDQIHTQLFTSNNEYLSFSYV